MGIAFKPKFKYYSFYFNLVDSLESNSVPAKKVKIESRKQNYLDSP